MKKVQKKRFANKVTFIVGTIVAMVVMLILMMLLRATKSHGRILVEDLCTYSATSFYDMPRNAVERGRLNSLSSWLSDYLDNHAPKYSEIYKAVVMIHEFDPDYLPKVVNAAVPKVLALYYVANPIEFKELIISYILGEEPQTYNRIFTLDEWGTVMWYYLGPTSTTDAMQPPTEPTSIP